MAIFHLHAQVISRSQGSSSVAAAAYRAAERLIDARTGRVHNFSRKQGVVYTAIWAPKLAPAWMRQRASLWAGVEAAERRKDAQVAREVQLALPQELTPKQRTELLEAYVRTQFVAHGMVADVALHLDNPANPHAHILLTTRAVVAGAAGQEARFGAKERALNARALLLSWRTEWTHACNRALQRNGHAVRIDHRSYANRGIALEPTPKLEVGRAHRGPDGRRFVVDRAAQHAAVVRGNGAAILKDPGIALLGITYQRATFTRTEMGRYLRTYTADATQFQACLAQVMASAELVRLPQREGEPERFTTQTMLRAERAMVEHALALQGRNCTHPVSALLIEEATRNLPNEARAAATYVLEQPDVAVVEGYAGAGKSTLLRLARRGWEGAGYRVLGGALSGKAAEGLEATAGISSRSLTAWAHAWSRGQDLLGPDAVLVVDEAGLVGTRQMEALLGTAAAAGSKVVLVGDSQQLQAIEAGAPLRLLGQEVGHFALVQVQRQLDPSHRKNSMLLAQGAAAEALERYRQAGAVRAHATREGAVAAAVDAWDGARQGRPLLYNSVLLAYRRADVAELNAAARCRLLQRGLLRPGRRLEMERGTRTFAVGDRVVFLRNDRGLGVKNGTLGTVLALGRDILRVQLDGRGPVHQTITVDSRAYRALDHGYALTVHKAQGVTVDRAFVLASPLFDRHTSYVALTRHREGVELHYSREDFASFADLSRTLARSRPKDMARDYGAGDRVDAPASVPSTPTLPRLTGQQAPLAAGGEASCRARVAHYEEMQRRLAQEQAYLARAVPQTLESVRAQHPQLVAAEHAVSRTQHALADLHHRAAQQRGIEADYRHRHPWRAQLGLERPRKVWRHTWQALGHERRVVEAGLADARQAQEALVHDPVWQQDCVRAVETSRQHLEDWRQRATERAKALAQQESSHARDLARLSAWERSCGRHENHSRSSDSDLDRGR